MGSRRRVCGCRVAGGFLIQILVRLFCSLRFASRWSLVVGRWFFDSYYKGDDKV